MLAFTKGFIKPCKTKLATPFKVKSDVEKIEEIKNRLHPNKTFNGSVNHMERVNNLKKLK